MNLSFVYCRPELANVSQGTTRSNQGAKGTLGENDEHGCATLQLRVQPNGTQFNTAPTQAYRLLDLKLEGPVRSKADQVLLVQSEEKTGLRPQSRPGAHGAHGESSFSRVLTRTCLNRTFLGVLCVRRMVAAGAFGSCDPLPSTLC